MPLAFLLLVGETGPTVGWAVAGSIVERPVGRRSSTRSVIGATILNEVKLIAHSKTLQNARLFRLQNEKLRYFSKFFDPHWLNVVQDD